MTEEIDAVSAYPPEVFRELEACNISGCNLVHWTHGIAGGD